MVFSSLPLYLDPPNWSNHEQQNHQEASSSISHGGGSNAHHLHTPAPAAAAAAASGQARPGPMAERARLMKIPQPEAVLRCPRCDSSNTKFCYFNNYSLSQPRHFCKACRRYWTRGGALRNVPVGGGCRRNRRSKSAASSSSKSRPATATSAGNILPMAPPPFLPSSPWQPLQDYYTSSSASGIGFSGLSSSLGTEQWRIQPFPSLWGGSEPPSDTAAQEFPGMYPFQGDGVSSGLITQLANVKMEGVMSINDPQQFWSATIASGQGGSSLFGGGSAGNGGGGGGYMNINEVSGGFKSSFTAGLS